MFLVCVKDAASMGPEMSCYHGNPFRSTNKTDFFNIVTGGKAISTGLVNAKSKGIQAMKKAEENGADAVEPSELVTFIQKLKKPEKP